MTLRLRTTTRNVILDTSFRQSKINLSLLEFKQSFN